MKKTVWNTRKTDDETKRRDRTRDMSGVKAKRKQARKSKDSRRNFERGDWS